MSYMGLKRFLKTLDEALEEEMLDDAIQLVSNPKHANKIKKSSPEIISVITEYLTRTNQVYTNELFHCCIGLMRQVCERSDPEDAMEQILLEMEVSIDVTQYLALLDPFQTVLLRLVGKNDSSFIAEKCIDMFEAFNHRLSLPDYTGEKAEVNNEKRVASIICVMSKVFDVNKRLISSINIAQWDCNGWLKTLMKLLGHPLCFLPDVNLPIGLEIKMSALMEDIVDTVFKFTKDPVTFYYNVLDDESLHISRLGLSNLFYLVYYENICLDQTPRVYSAEFMFKTLIQPICWFWHNANRSQCLVDKAVKLAQVVVNNVQGHSLSYSYLECYYQKRFCKLLCKEIILSHNTDRIWERALELLTLYCNCFELKGFYLILWNLLRKASHASLRGHLISLYKDRLVKEFEKHQDNNKLSEYFKGAKLRSFLKQCCHHLIEQMMINDFHARDQFDQVVVTLELFKYLAIREKKTNNTIGFRVFMPTLKNNYLTPLETIVDKWRTITDPESFDLSEEDLSKILVWCDQVQNLLDQLNDIFG